MLKFISSPKSYFMAEKLKPQITSPGEAWMNFVNSKEGHNAAAVTPEYLKPQQRTPEVKPSEPAPPVPTDSNKNTPDR